jgi:penicillin-binding protein 2
MDRNGSILVYNEPVYDLLILPQQTKPFDTLGLCGIIQVDVDEFRAAVQKARDYSIYRQSLVARQIPADRIATLQEKLFKYPGFYVEIRTQRRYPKPIAPHVLGYVGEVDQQDISSDTYYQAGDYKGKSGIELNYEEELRGRKGIHFLLVDVRNRIQGSFDNGRFDTLPEPGRNLSISIDATLQEYGEKLMARKVGSIVAIEPSTGEILALVSSPGYDPNELVGRLRGLNYDRLINDSLNPLFNRATMSRYSPGSIFKIVQALVGLKLGVIDEYSAFACNKGIIGCHEHPSARNLMEALKYSCNPYFYQVYRRIILQGKSMNQFQDAAAGLGQWRELVMTMGLGQVLPVDIPGVKSGMIPDEEYYNKKYGKNRWSFSTIYSNSIGQGEVEMVPIQVANLAATVANKGFYFVPHLIKAIEGSDTLPRIYKEPVRTPFDPAFFDIMADGMASVVYDPGGTGYRAQVPGFVVCGKTGTVQNVHGEDHSGFMAFAPKEAPKIAVVAYVENSGAGGLWGASIASLIMEKYLTGTVMQTQKEIEVMNYIQF